MPAGPTSLGFVYFAGVKLAGYTVAGCALNWLYGRTVCRGPVMFHGEGVEIIAHKPVAYANPVLFGIMRTMLGILGGLAIYAIGAIISEDYRLFYLILAPIRYAEWLLIIWWFYGRASPGVLRLAGYSLFGSIWSCILDIPAVAAIFLLPKGCWIC